MTIYKKKRLDMLLVEKHLAPTRSRAADLVRDGAVSVGGLPVRKPAALVAEDSALAISPAASPYVSRGGLKLRAALDAFGFEVEGRVALDLGASTGGFTDVLLERGAARVYAVDVGRGQLDQKLQADTRVISLEQTDARTLDSGLIPEPVGAIVADVSFISLTQALPNPLALARPGAWLVALVKPQYEAGRDAVGKGGIVKHPANRRRALARVREFIEAQAGWRLRGEIVSPILGRSGNEEFLLGVVHGA